MKNMDRALLREWVDLDLDGHLPTGDRDRLRQALEEDAELRREQQVLRGLHAALQEGKVAVRPHFLEQVMERLPVAPWESSVATGRLPAWALPTAMVVLLAVASSLILASGTSGIHLMETASMVSDLVKTSLLAGSGLLFATWRGVGFGLEEMVGDSNLSLAAFGVLVLCLNLLFISLLRRRRSATAVSTTSASTTPTSRRDPSAD